MNRLKLFSIIVLCGLLFFSCRDWFGEDNQPETIVGNQPPPLSSITITSPEYGSVWKPGDVLTISWITSRPIEKVDIELYRKDNYQFYLTRGKASDGSFQWQIPEVINHSVHYRIKIINPDRASEYTISKSFAIRD